MHVARSTAGELVSLRQPFAHAAMFPAVATLLAFVSSPGKKADTSVRKLYGSSGRRGLNQVNRGLGTSGGFGH